MTDCGLPIYNIGRLAASQGLTALSDSHGIVMARNAPERAPLAADGRALTATPTTPSGTDDFSNILSVLHAR